MRLSNCVPDLKDEKHADIAKTIVKQLIEIWKTYDHRFSDIVSTRSYFDFIDMFKSSISKNIGDISAVCRVLFDDIDFKDFPHDAYEFYHSIFSELLIQFFNSHSNKSLRSDCKNAIIQLEQAIGKINCERSKRALYKAVIISVQCARFLSDWSGYKAEYSYQDKLFLNEQFSKYGKYYLEDVIQTIYKLHHDKLLPEILISLSEVFTQARELDKRFANTVKENKIYISLIITDAFLNHSDAIKSDEELTNSFETILKMLISLNFESAAVILDEFRVH